MSIFLPSKLYSTATTQAPANQFVNLAHNGTISCESVRRKRVLVDTRYPSRDCCCCCASAIGACWLGKLVGPGDACRTFWKTGSWHWMGEKKQFLPAWPDDRALEVNKFDKKNSWKGNEWGKCLGGILLKKQLAMSIKPTICYFLFFKFEI